MQLFSVPLIYIYALNIISQFKYKNFFNNDLYNKGNQVLSVAEIIL